MVLRVCMRMSVCGWCVCICVVIYACEGLRGCVCVYDSISVWVRASVVIIYVYVCIYEYAWRACGCVYVCARVCVCVCMYVCVWVCMYV